MKYTLRNRWGVCHYYGEAGRALYEQALAARQQAQTCVMCNKEGATQQLVGTGRRVHQDCAVEVGIPTILLTDVEA